MSTAKTLEGDRMTSEMMYDKLYDIYAQLNKIRDIMSGYDLLLHELRDRSFRLERELIELRMKLQKPIGEK